MSFISKYIENPALVFDSEVYYLVEEYCKEHISNYDFVRDNCVVLYNDYKPADLKRIIDSLEAWVEENYDEF